jgi:hypothetical protein
MGKCQWKKSSFKLPPGPQSAEHGQWLPLNSSPSAFYYLLYQKMMIKDGWQVKT